MISAKPRWIQPFLRGGLPQLAGGFEEAVLSDESEHVVRFYTELQNGTINPERVGKLLADERISLLSFPTIDAFRRIADRFRTYGDPLDLILLERTMRVEEPLWVLKKRPWVKYFGRSWAMEVIHQLKRMSSVIGSKWCFICETWTQTLQRTAGGDSVYVDPFWMGMSPARSGGARVPFAIGRAMAVKNELWSSLSGSEASFLVVRRCFGRRSPDLLAWMCLADFVKMNLLWLKKPGPTGKGWPGFCRGATILSGPIYNMPCLSVVPPRLG